MLMYVRTYIHTYAYVCCGIGIVPRYCVCVCVCVCVHMYIRMFKYCVICMYNTYVLLHCV